jgi:thiol:disulfide interchange protein
MICRFFVALYFFFFSFSSLFNESFYSPQADVVITHTQLPERDGNFYIVVDISPKAGWYLYWENPGDTGMAPKVEFILPAYAKSTFLGFPPPTLLKKKPFTSYVFNSPFTLIFQITTKDRLLPKDIKIDINWLACKTTCVTQNFLTTLEEKAIIPIKEAQKKVDLLAQDIFQGTLYERDKKLYISIPHSDKEFEFSEAYFFPKEQEYIHTDANQQLQKNTENKKHQNLLSVSLLNHKDHVTGLLMLKSKDETKWFIIDHDLEPEPVHTSESSLLLIILGAIVGGFLLNLMPCVFPVLSLKILHILEHVETRRALFRHGLSYAAGIFVTFISLFMALTILKSAGHSVGWGFQLQSPFIIILLIAIFTILSLNLFGVFEFRGLEISSTMGLDHKKLFTSFFNGMLTTLVATPCTAPFMGTAIAVALSQSLFESFLIFTGLSFGLSFPFLVLCLFPEALKILPKPGQWMKTFKEFLAFPLIGAVVWLLWVLESIKPTSIISVLIAISTLIFIVWLFGQLEYSSKNFITLKIIPLIACFTLFFYNDKSPFLTQCLFVVVGIICATLLYIFVKCIRTYQVKHFIKYVLEALLALFCSLAFIPLIQTFDTTKTMIQGIIFSEDVVQNALKKGRPVFINYTARWCITCQINKLNVLSNEEIKKAFKEKDILYIEADWTNHSHEISKSLKEYHKESIPLYVLKIPGNKKPIILPELLTTKDVLDALSKIKG